MRQLLRVVLESRIDFQNDVVLAELRVDGRDLPLSEGVIERVIDELQRNAEPAGGAAVDADRGL